MTLSSKAGKRQDKALFQRLVVLHRPDCTAMTQPVPVIVSDEIDVARVLGSDEAGRYAVEARGIYEDLRRLVGQLAGLLILARLTSKRDVADLAELGACRLRQTSIDTALDRLSAPGPLAAHRSALEDTARLCAAILDGLPKWNPDGPGADADFASMNAKIRHAYACLEKCSSEKAGLQMVDFTHACCSCGGH